MKRVTIDARESPIRSKYRAFPMRHVLTSHPQFFKRGPLLGIFCVKIPAERRLRVSAEMFEEICVIKRSS